MYFVPVILSILGLFIGPAVAKKLDNCPHRGKVWGAFILPLLALFYPPLQMHAVAVSFSAAVAAGLTAHGSFSVTLAAVTIGCSVAVLLGNRIV